MIFWLKKCTLRRLIQKTEQNLTFEVQAVLLIRIRSDLVHFKLPDPEQAKIIDKIAYYKNLIIFFPWRNTNKLVIKNCYCLN